MSDASLAETVQVTVAKVAVKQDAMKEQNDRMEREIGTIAEELRAFTKTFSDNYVLKEIYTRDREDDQKRFSRIYAWTVGTATTFFILVVATAIDITARK